MRSLVSFVSFAFGSGCCIVVSPLAAIYAWQTVGKAQKRRRVEGIRDVPGAVPQVACRLELSCDGVVYGRDVGLVSIVEGWCVFDGCRTSFSFPFPKWSEFWHSNRRVQANFMVDDVRFSVQMRPFDVREATIFDRRKEFPPPLSVEYVVYPPTRPTDEVFAAQGGMFLAAILATAAAVIVVGVCDGAAESVAASIFLVAPCSYWLLVEMRRRQALVRLNARRFAVRVAELPRPRRRAGG